MDPIAKVRLLLRAEILRGRIAARSLAVRATFYAVAGLLALVGIVMLVVAAYLALAEAVGPVYAALIMGAALLALAILLALLARPLSRGRDAEIAAELERIALAELTSELQSIERQVKSLNTGLALLSGLGRGPLALVGLLLGLAAAVSPRLRLLLASLMK